MAQRVLPQAGPTDPNPIAQRLLRSVPMASLATAAADQEGWPYASLVAMAVEHDGTPVLLLSRLSDHTKNLDHDPRASLLLDATAGIANRMAGERLTLMGHLAPASAALQGPARRRYLARHPAAAAYEGFADFAYYRMRVERAHLIGGFAKAYWLEAAGFLPALPKGYALVDAEASILEHMNDNHRDAVQLYANVLAKKPGQGWRLTGVDGWGLDLRRGADTARVPFPAPVHDAGGAKDALIGLVRQARSPEPHG
ncbi:MAG: DUF2470 domain-containing protein [Geminicoccaceae bacterium]|nr:MAG: DUF2470 domain-containing protein [Geminicoccaceae bacterium]